MKVYIASRFGRREEMKLVATQLEDLGVEITSRWLVLEEDENPTEEMLEERAEVDRDDVRRCDILVRYTDDLSTPTIPSSWGTASRMEEAGMAYAWGKKVIVVGGNQSLFDRLASRVHFETTEDMLFQMAIWMRWEAYEEAQADEGK